jgi:hypothetical protein
VSEKTDRRVARETVAAYHEEQLGELVRRVASVIDRFQAGELAAFEVDDMIFQYSRAAKELWKFCNMGQVEVTARIVRDEPPGDWWDRGARRTRRGGPCAGGTSVRRCMPSLDSRAQAVITLGPDERSDRTHPRFAWPYGQRHSPQRRQRFYRQPRTARARAHGPA